MHYFWVIDKIHDLQLISRWVCPVLIEFDRSMEFSRAQVEYLDTVC